MGSDDVQAILERLDDLSLRIETVHGLVERRSDELQNLINRRSTGIESALLKVCEKLLAPEEHEEVRREFVG